MVENVKMLGVKRVNNVEVIGNQRDGREHDDGELGQDAGAEAGKQALNFHRVDPLVKVNRQ